MNKNLFFTLNSKFVYKKKRVISNRLKYFNFKNEDFENQCSDFKFSKVSDDLRGFTLSIYSCK